MQKAIILSIESSGKYGSVSLSKGEKILYSAISFIDQSHSAMLAQLIENSFQAAKVSPGQLQAIAVGSGPGSYTGLRIGVSLAKGLCFSLNIPLISVGTMQNLAFQAIQNFKKGKIFCLLDARRNEAYAQIFDQNLQASTGLKAIELENFKPDAILQNEEILLAGDGAKKTLDFFQSPQNWNIETSIYPNARTISALALNKFEMGEFEPLAAFEPEYLKPVYLTQAAG